MATTQRSLHPRSGLSYDRSPILLTFLSPLFYSSSTPSSPLPREYTALSSFLSTSGPLLTAAHRLLGEPYLRCTSGLEHLWYRTLVS